MEPGGTTGMDDCIGRSVESGARENEAACGQSGPAACQAIEHRQFSAAEVDTSSLEGEAEGRNCAKRFGRGYEKGDQDLESEKLAKAVSGRSLVETIHKYGPQLEQQVGPQSVETVAHRLSQRFGEKRIKIDSKHGLMFKAGRGARHRISVSGRGEIKAAFADDPNAYEVHSVESLLDAIAERGIDRPADREDSSVTVDSLYGLLERQAKRCALTGRQLDHEDLELDHINPVSRSGDHSIANVQLVVTEANRAKGCMDMEAFVRLCNDVARTHPR